MTRVLIADDSATSRAALAAILDSDPAIEVVGVARDGREVVELAATQRPQIITMDIDMPGLDGIEATRQIMRETPTPIVIVSSLIGQSVSSAFDAMRAGALAVMAKPPAPTATTYAAYRRELLSTLKAMGTVLVLRRRGRAAPHEERPKRVGSGETAAVIAVAASTGGPPALERLLGGLRPSRPVPLLIVQHISLGFVGGLVEWLDRVSPWRVELARDGDELKNGTAYVAPDERHLAVARGHVALLDEEKENGFRPSASVLFRSVAAEYGRRCACAILTGMGSDGVDGLRAVRECGGGVVAQDRDSSVVFGMPQAAIDAGLADTVLPIDQIGRELTRWVDYGIPRGLRR